MLNRIFNDPRSGRRNADWRRRGGVARSYLTSRGSRGFWRAGWPGVKGWGGCVGVRRMLEIGELDAGVYAGMQLARHKAWAGGAAGMGTGRQLDASVFCWHGAGVAGRGRWVGVQVYEQSQSACQRRLLAGRFAAAFGGGAAHGRS